MATTALSTQPDIRRSKNPRWPAGPTFLSRVLSGRLFQQPVEFMVEMAREHGDLIHYRAAGRHVFQFNHPELVQELLVRDVAEHHRGVVMQKARDVLGHGLLTSEEPFHMRQRRLAQPAFHRNRIAVYAETMGRYAAEATSVWSSGETRNLHADMQLLTLRIVGKTLFDTELEADNRKIAHAVDAFMAFLPLVFLPFAPMLQKLPLPAMRRIRQSRVDLDALIYGWIRDRRGSSEDRGDLLSMLIASVDDESAGACMTDEQVRDESITMLLAGNETTANGLTFAIWLLAAHPDVQEAVAAEAAAVLGDRAATADDYPRLKLTWMCFAEALRLYPPVWVTARTAARGYEYRGFHIPPGSILLASQASVHRDPRFWDAPEQFLPEQHFNEAARAARTKMSFFPFAAGSRQCIGEGLAWMEGVLTLASIIRDWRLRPAAGAAATLKVESKVTLRPKGGLPLIVEKR